MRGCQGPLRAARAASDQSTRVRGIGPDDSNVQGGSSPFDPNAFLLPRPSRNHEWLVDDVVLPLSQALRCSGPSLAQSRPIACGSALLTSLNVALQHVGVNPLS